jgi:hypothetical protein
MLGNVFLIDKLKPIETSTRRGYFVSLSPAIVTNAFQVDSSFPFPINYLIFALIVVFVEGTN